MAEIEVYHPENLLPNESSSLHSFYKSDSFEETPESQRYGCHPGVHLEILRYSTILFLQLVVWMVVLINLMKVFFVYSLVWKCHRLCGMPSDCKDTSLPWDTSSCRTIVDVEDKVNNMTLYTMSWVSSIKVTTPLSKFFAPGLQMDGRIIPRVDGINVTLGVVYKNNKTDVYKQYRLTRKMGISCPHHAYSEAKDSCVLFGLASLTDFHTIDQVRVVVSSLTPFPEENIFDTGIVFLLESQLATSIGLMVRHTLILLCLTLLVLHIRTWLKSKPRHYIPPSLKIMIMLALLILYINPFMLLAIWTQTHFFVFLNRFLESHCSTLYVSGIGAYLLYVIQRAALNMKRNWIIPSLWWLCCFATEVYEINVNGIAKHFSFMPKCSNFLNCPGAVIRDILMMVWFVVMSILFYLAWQKVNQLPYLQTRKMRLALLFSVNMIVAYYVGNIIILGLFLFTSFKQRDYSLLNAPGSGMISILVIIAAYVYLPLNQSHREGIDRPPFPWERWWVHQRWSTRWEKFLRANGGYEMYFFYTNKEREQHINVQGGRKRSDAFYFRQQSTDWSPASVLIRLTHRHYFRSTQLFCLELCIDLLRLSFEAYMKTSADDQKEMLNVERFGWKLIAVIEKDEQQCIIVSKDKTIAVAFRGTSNWDNVKTDVSVKLGAVAFRGMQHHHRHGHKPWCCCWQLPMAHQGFLSAYYALKCEVHLNVKFALESLQNCKDVQLYITGHSLGGAIATLAAYDLHITYLDLPITVYIFGAPRVGNASFAKIYDVALPRTYRICNENDIVAQVPPSNAILGYLFYHVGRQVCIDSKGNMIIDPSVLERFVRPIRGDSLASHLITSYEKSIDKVCLYFGVDLRCDLGLNSPPQ